MGKSPPERARKRQITSRSNLLINLMLNRGNGKLPKLAAFSLLLAFLRILPLLSLLLIAAHLPGYLEVSLLRAPIAPVH
jgi:hypothetical protein